MSAFGPKQKTQHAAFGGKADIDAGQGGKHLILLREERLVAVASLLHWRLLRGRGADV